MEWLKEEDYYKFEIKGFTCKIVRHPSLKHLCGYVHLKPNNVLYGIDYYYIDVDVHGGITFSAQKGSNWVIGFDCCHANDLVPQTYMLFKDVPFFHRAEVYRNVQFVKNELLNLVNQLIEFDARKLNQ